MLSTDSPWAGYTFTSRRRHGQISEEREDVSDVSNVESDYVEEDVESNNSNSDIIPFSEVRRTFYVGGDILSKCARVNECVFASVSHSTREDVDRCR